MFDKFSLFFEKLLTRKVIVAGFLFTGFEVVDLFIHLGHAIVNFDFKMSVEGFDYKPFTGFLIVFFNVLIVLEVIETLRLGAESYREKAKLILLISLIAVA